MCIASAERCQISAVKILKYDVMRLRFLHIRDSADTVAPPDQQYSQPARDGAQPHH